MNKYLLIVVAFLFIAQFSVINAQDSSVATEKYNVWRPNGIGIQYGAGSIWLNYKRFFPSMALEANFGYLSGGTLGFIPRFQLNAMRPYDIPVIENLQWYWGIGAHYQAAQVPYFQIGGNILLGLEYNIKEWNSSIYVDWGVQPSYRGKNQKGMLIEYPGRFGFRYRF